MSLLRAGLADKVGSNRFELWFSGGTRFRLDDGTLFVETASQFLQGWLSTHFRRDIEAVCAEVLSHPVTVRFNVDVTLADGDRALGAKGGEVAPEKKTSPKLTREADRRAPALATKVLGIGSPCVGKRRRQYADLATFVVGQSNKLAFTAAQTVVEQAGSVSPVVFYGGTGVGKTHLLEGVLSAARKINRGIHAVYLTAEGFTTAFLEALHGRGLPSFRHKYRGVDLLLMDDLHFFVGKKATLVELLHTVDTLLVEGRQVVFTSDRPPTELLGLGQDLCSRLSGGLVCRIEPADYPTRLGIVRQLSERLGVELSEEVQSLIASQLSSHARELAGAVNRLHASSVARQQPITRGLAQEVLGELQEQNTRLVHLSDIQRAVSDVFGIPPNSLQSSSTVRSLSYPRMLAMWLARKHTRAALGEIGNFFGGRSHSTVVSARKKVETWMNQKQSLHLAEHSCHIEEVIRRVENVLKTA